jgi:hypothetical protein
MPSLYYFTGDELRKSITEHTGAWQINASSAFPLVEYPIFRITDAWSRNLIFDEQSDLTT